MIITNVDLLANSSNHAMFPEYLRNIPRMSVSKIFHGYPQNILVKLFLCRLKDSSLRRLEDIDLWRLEDVWFKTFWRRLFYVVLKTSDFWRLADAWFMSSYRRQIYVILRTSILRRLQAFWFTSSWECLIFLKTPYLHRLKDVLFASSWRLPVYDVFKTPAKRRLCSNVVVTSIQRQKKCFFPYFVLSEIFRKF